MQTATVAVTVRVGLDVDTYLAVRKMDASVLESIRKAIANVLIEANDDDTLDINSLGHYVTRVEVEDARLEHVSAPPTNVHVFRPDHNLFCTVCGLGELAGDHGMIPSNGGASGTDFSPVYENDEVRAMYDAELDLSEFEDERPDYQLRAQKEECGECLAELPHGYPCMVCGSDPTLTA